MARTQQLIFENVRSVAFGAITNAFLPLGSVFGGPVSTLFFYNGTDALIQISFDGTNAHWQSSASTYDQAIGTAAGYDSSKAFFPENIQMYVRYTGAAPTLGIFWVNVLRLQNV